MSSDPSTKRIAAGALDKLLVEFGSGFEKYIDRNYHKCRYVKTLLHRIDPIPIEAAHVDPSFMVRKKIVSELRDLNDQIHDDLFSHIHQQWADLIPSFNSARMEYGLRAGKFAVLLDGLDEIDFHVRDIYCKQIINMTYKYPDCLFLISSRPDDRFDSWNEFYVSEIQPLSKAQIILLVEKMQFDPATKANFLKQIDARLYKTHGEFLSNPLLCTMMLMTFNEFEEIPSKMYIFYARAFEALFTRHDKTKTFFKRKFYTTLAEDDFKRLFSTFCLFSYTDMKFAFNSVEVRKYIKSAIEYEQSGVSVDNFLKDLVESTSLLLKEGDNYSFIHRSFQEYLWRCFSLSDKLPKWIGFLSAFVPIMRVTLSLRS
jgi:predicted NACHT family NTPase